MFCGHDVETIQFGYCDRDTGSEDGKRCGDGEGVVELSRIMPNSSIAPSYDTKTFTE
jgi:hypothetical protein